MQESLLIGSFFLSATLLATSALAAHRVDTPTANLLGTIAALLAAGATVLGISLLREAWLLALGTAITVGMVLPVLWLSFTVTYVGKDEFATRANAMLIGTPVLMGIAATGILFGSRSVQGSATLTPETVTGLGAIGLTALTLIQWFGLLYAGGLLLTGCGVILWAFQRYDHLDSITGIILGTFAAVPWLALLFGLQLAGVSIVAFAGTISVGLFFGGVAGLLLVGPSPRLRHVPSAGHVGPRRIMNELTDLVIVSDQSGTIIETNRRTRGMLGNPGGDHVGDVLGVAIDELSKREVIDIETTTGRVLYSPTVSTLTDHHGQLLGHGIVLRDLTDQTTRRQLLEVFNRVLRHNVRNDMTVVLGRAELIERRSEGPEIRDNAEAILTNGEKLLDLSEKVREAERVLEIDPVDSDATTVKPVVEDVIASVETERDPRITYVGPNDGAAAIPRPLFVLLLRNLVKNAVEHTDEQQPNVEVEVKAVDDATYPLQVTVRDDGPGIPPLERRVIEQGSETQLEHGSGIGLWIVRVATTKLGGKLTFNYREPRGTEVTVHLPTPLDTTAADQGRTDHPVTTNRRSRDHLAVQ